MVQVPADVLIGRTTGADALAGLAVQAGWLAAAALAGRLLLAAGRRRLLVQGG